MYEVLLNSKLIEWSCTQPASDACEGSVGLSDPKPDSVEQNVVPPFEAETAEPRTVESGVGAWMVRHSRPALPSAWSKS